MAARETATVQNMVTTLFNLLDTNPTYQPVTDASGRQRMQRVAVTFVSPRGVSHEAFARQVQGQQNGLNAMRVPEWGARRATYLQGGRAATGTQAQEAFRDAARAQLIVDKTREFRNAGRSLADARRLATVYANRELGRTNALHNPDQISGGDPTNITELGADQINAAIGSQWRTSVLVLDAAIARVPANLAPTLLLNVGLRTTKE